MKTIGERIYDLREDEFITIRNLAKELQISESQLSRIESGKTATISSDILTGLARRFHVSTDYFSVFLRSGRILSFCPTCI